MANLEARNTYYMENDLLYIINKMRGLVPYYGFSGTMIQIIFLSYLTNIQDRVETNPNLHRLYTMDTSKIMAYQSMLLSSEFKFDVVNELYDAISESCNDNQHLLSYACNTLSNTFNGNVNELFKVIRSIDVPNDVEKIKHMVMSIIEYAEAGDISKTRVHSTNNSLIKLVLSILDIKEKDYFVECFSGFSKMSLEIKKGFCECYEIDSNAAAVALMIKIMTNNTNLEIHNTDYYQIIHKERATKLFSDGLFGVDFGDKIYFPEMKYGKKSDPYNIILPLEELKDGGQAVITALPQLLYSNQKNFIELRKDIIPHLVAVIALPSMWSRTSVATNLLFFEKNSNKNNIMFIDGSSLGMVDRRRQVNLQDEDIDIILKCLQKEKEGMAKLISKDYILATEDILLSPSKYIRKKVEISYRNVEEIEKDLKVLYNELNSLIEE